MVLLKALSYLCNQDFKPEQVKKWGYMVFCNFKYTTVYLENINFTNTELNT